MELTVGQTVVHPQHGVATVADVETREIDGDMVSYVVLARPKDHLTLRVPADLCEEVGVRGIIDAADVDSVLAVLGEDATSSDATWRKQHARNEARLNSGDVREVAAAVRDLYVRDEERGLSTSDSVLYDKARGRLIGELSAALGKDEAEVEDLVDETLAAR